MHVCIDQSGHDIAPAKIHDAHTGWSWRTDRFNPAAAHHHRDVAGHGAASHIDDGRIGERESFLRRHAGALRVKSRKAQKDNY